MSAVTNILQSFKHGSITQAQAAAEIEELIELERLQLRDTFAGQAMQGICAHPDTWGLDVEGIAERMFKMADAALKVRASTCTKSQTLAHYTEQALLAKLEQANAELVQVAIDFKEAMAETSIAPCECGEADCRTTRLRAALAKAGVK